MLGFIRFSLFSTVDSLAPVPQQPFTAPHQKTTEIGVIMWRLTHLILGANDVVQRVCVRGSSFFSFM
jgi:hypothetical protein